MTNKAPNLIDIPVDPITGPVSIFPKRKPEPVTAPAALRGPLGDTAAEPYENEG